MSQRGFSLAVAIAAIILVPAHTAVAQSTWSTASGGNWHDAANWLGGVPDAADATAAFGPTQPVSGSTVLLDGSATLGVMEIGGPASITFDVAPTDPDSESIFDAGAAQAELLSVSSSSSPRYDFNTAMRLDSDLLVEHQGGAATEAVFTFNGAISGDGELTLRSGVILAGDNGAFTGDVTIDAGEGVVEVLKEPSLGCGAIDLRSGILFAHTDNRHCNANVTINGGELWMPNITRINGHVTQVTGRFSPGYTGSTGTAAGLTAIVGEYEQGSDSIFHAELAGFGYLLFDRLHVYGPASLEGALDVTLVDGFIPDPTDVYAILIATSITGQFTNATDRIFVGGGWFDVVYSSTQVTLANFAPIPEPATLLLLVPAGVLLAGYRAPIPACRAGPG